VSTDPRDPGREEPSQLPGPHAAIAPGRGRRLSVPPTENGNTVSVCRKCYVHPQMIGTYMEVLLDSSFAHQYKLMTRNYMKKGFREDEAFFLALLQGCSKRKAQAA